MRPHLRIRRIAAHRGVAGDAGAGFLILRGFFNRHGFGLRLEQGAAAQAVLHQPADDVAADAVIDQAGVFFVCGQPRAVDLEDQPDAGAGKGVALVQAFDEWAHCGGGLVAQQPVAPRAFQIEAEQRDQFFGLHLAVNAIQWMQVGIEMAAHCILALRDLPFDVAAERQVSVDVVQVAAPLDLDDVHVQRARRRVARDQQQVAAL